MEYLLVILIIVNGFFAMSEMALVSVKKAKVQMLIENGNSNATTLIKLVENPIAFLSVVQIGLTVIGILNGMIGESALSPYIMTVLNFAFSNFQIGNVVLENVATGISIFVIVFFTIIFGELIPKRVGQVYADSIALKVAKLLYAITVVSKPAVFMLDKSSIFFMNIFGIRRDDQEITEEDLHIALRESADLNVIRSEELNMVGNIFTLNDRNLTSLMTPKNEFVSLASNEMSDLIELLTKYNHSCYPYFDNGEFIGVVDVKKSIVANAVVHEEPLYVPETITGIDLLNSFKHNGKQFALVIDEYSQIIGIVTIYDILEAVAGNLKDNKPHMGWVEDHDGYWTFDANTPMHLFASILDLQMTPNNLYNTLSGFVMFRLGKVPNIGETVDLDGYTLTVEEKDGIRVKTVKVSVDSR